MVGKYKLVSEMDSISQNQGKSFGDLSSLGTGLVLSLFLLTASAGETNATPCSCWDSGTTKHMGAKCYGAWTDMGQAGSFNWPELKLEIPKTQADAKKEALTWLFNLMINGAQTMEACHGLCNELKKKLEKEGIKFLPWWYADETAFQSCKDDFKDVVDKY